MLTVAVVIVALVPDHSQRGGIVVVGRISPEFWCWGASLVPFATIAFIWFGGPCGTLSTTARTSLLRDGLPGKYPGWSELGRLVVPSIRSVSRASSLRQQSADVRDRPVQDLDRGPNFVFADDERRLQPDHRGLFSVYAAHMPRLSIWGIVSSPTSSVANSTPIMRPLPRT